jgi:O-antigen/teichoic acid export membrane protein
MIFKKLNLQNLDFKNKRLIKNTLFTFIVKGGATIISFFMMPAYMRFFENPDILGLWFTALSILSWFLVFDLGVGNGLRNYLVKSFTDNNDQDIKKYISSAYILVGAAVIIISILGYFIFSFIDWNKIFNVSKNVLTNNILLLVVRIIFIGIMLQFLLRLISSILMAMQKPAIPNFVGLISNSLLLLFLLFMNSSTIERNLINLSIVNMITTVIPLSIITLLIFSTKLKNYVPNFKFYSSIHVKNIVKLGGVFFWIQIMYLIISNTNEFLINWLIGSRFVVDYKIYNSLFGLIGTLFILALGPVWSEVTEAYAKSEINWIKKLYNRLFKLALIAVFGIIVLIFSVQFIVDIWLKERAIKMDIVYSIIFAGSVIMTIWSSILSSFIAGFGKLKIPFIYLTIGAALNILLSILFAKFLGTWIAIILANVFSLIPYCVFQTIWLNKYFKKLENELSM